jgi:uncharacterized membrane protein YesL
VIIKAIKVWWDEWFKMVSFSLIWLFSWITIIFGPPVTFAYYYFAQKLVDESYPTTREIIEVGKSFFVKSWQWMLGNLLVFFLLVANYMFYRQFAERWDNIIRTILLAIGLLWLGVQFYALPYFMLQEEKSLRTAWRNGIFTILATPFYTLVLWIFGVLIAVLSIGTVIPVFLGVPGIIVVLGSQAVTERLITFKIIEEKTDKR